MRADNANPQRITVTIRHDERGVLKQVDAPPIESLVLEGGGVRGLGYIGATRALFEAGIMQNIKRIAGSSAGALNAVIIALGYGPTEISNIIRGINMAELEDARDLLLTQKIQKLMRDGHINEGNNLLALIRKIIETRVVSIMEKYIRDHKNDPAALTRLQQLNIHPDRITFKNLKDLAALIPEAGIKDIYITGTRLSANPKDAPALEIFSAETHPGMEIALAARISASIPKFFRPVELDGYQYVDGGCLCNFPIGIFNNEKYRPAGDYRFIGDHFQNISSLGVKIDTQQELEKIMHAPLKNKSVVEKISGGLIDWITGVKTTRANDKIDMSVREQYSHTTCQLGDEGISMVEFAITPDRQQRLIDRGYRDMRNWLHNYHHAKLETKTYASFNQMCHEMGIEELRTFCEALANPNTDLIDIADRSRLPGYHEIANHILKMKCQSQQILSAHLSTLIDLLIKYDPDNRALKACFDSSLEITEALMWRKICDRLCACIMAGSPCSTKQQDLVHLNEIMKMLENVGQPNNTAAEANNKMPIRQAIVLLENISIKLDKLMAHIAALKNNDEDTKQLISAYRDMFSTLGLSIETIRNEPLQLEGRLNQQNNNANNVSEIIDYCEVLAKVKTQTNQVHALMTKKIEKHGFFVNQHKNTHRPATEPHTPKKR